MTTLRQRFLLFVASALLLPCIAPGQTNASPAVHQQSRIPAHADLSQRSTLAGHRPAWARPENDLGEIAPEQPLEIVVGLTRDAAVQSAFDQLLADQQNPASPRFHQWLQPVEVGQQFGPTADDLAMLATWLTAQGLQVDGVAPSGIFIQASGPAALIARAFGTSLHTFTSAAGTRLRAPASDPTIPAAFAPLVAHVSGLTEVVYATHLQHQLAPAPKPATSVRPDATFSGGTVHLLSPADFATIYDLNPAYSAGIKGAGQKMMIIGGSRLLASDLTTWEQLTGLPSYQPNYIVPPGTGFADPGITSDDNQAEGTLDFERAYGTAPGATVDQIISTNWLNGTVTENLILYAIGTVNDPVLSMSFGSCEAMEPAGYVAQEDQMFAVAAAQGISVFASSGDAGVAGCENHGTAAPAAQTASVSDICASGNVTCVGGTEFNDTAANWQSTNTSTFESALGYINEGAWNEPTSTNSSGQAIDVVAATGGGPSTIIARPSWQTGTGVTAGTYRLTPDISVSASLHNGYFGCLAYAGADCSQYIEVFAGTSASAPSVAGLAALIDQKLGARQGNLNPTFYGIFNSTPAAFHDATPTSSGVGAACSTATPSLCNNSNPSPTALTGGIAGYPLTTGYDLATGLGSPDLNQLLTAALMPTLAPVTIKITASPGTGSVTQNAYFTSTVSSAAITKPTGTLSFSINGSVVSFGSQPLAGGSLTASTTFPSAGTYTITASYAGDAANQAGKSSIAYTVNPLTGATTTTTITSSAFNITVAGTVTLTSTVTGAAGSATTPTGTVQFVASSVNTNVPILLGSPVALSAGKAVLTSAVPAGTYLLNAHYFGDSSNAASESSTIVLMVSGVPTTTTLISPPASAIVGLPLSAPLVAVVSGLTAAPSALATVTFMDGGFALGTGTLVVSGSGTGTTLKATLASATFSYSGSRSLTAVFSGDSTFAFSTSAPATVAVGYGAFSLSAATPSLTLASASSASGTDNIAINSSGFAGTISFMCSVALSSGTASVAPGCSITPAQVTYNAAGTSTVVTLTTIAPHEHSGQFAWIRGTSAIGAAAFAGMLLCGLRGRRTRARLAMVALLALSLLAGLAGCGGGTNSSTTAPPTTTTPLTGGTTTGSYVVTITGTAIGFPITTTTINLTVN